jgi:oligopeptidase B
MVRPSTRFSLHCNLALSTLVTLSPHWSKRYEDEGRLLNKKNTFSDYLACADHLVVEGWTQNGLIAAEGGSAAGILMGFVANERPSLFAAVLGSVPFVDAVVTMCDSSIPLGETKKYNCAQNRLRTLTYKRVPFPAVTTEFDEWGNPNEREAFDYMFSYDPMRNTRAQAYPAIFLTAGLNDSRVGYWEPAKFVQRLRASNTGPQHVLFKCEMDEGHVGALDRFRSLRSRALELAWMLDRLSEAQAKGGGAPRK